MAVNSEEEEVSLRNRAFKIISGDVLMSRIALQLGFTVWLGRRRTTTDLRWCWDKGVRSNAEHNDISARQIQCESQSVDDSSCLHSIKHSRWRGCVGK